MRVRRWSGVVLALSLISGIAGTTSAFAANPSPPFIPARADWLTSVNYFRAMAGLTPVVEDPALSPGAFNHSCYMLLNDISHDEVPGRPGYTASGDAAGNNSNVAVNSATGVSNRSFVELWMTGPFHAIGILRPNLQRVGYGQCELADTARWHSGATLDVLRGLGPQQAIAAPILFPGDGSVTNLTQFIAESPNPVQLCGWGTSGAGLPVIAMMPENFSSNPSATMTGPNGPVQTCVLSRHNTSGTAQSILGGDNATIVLPRSPLTAGTYTVSVTTSARAVTWSFTVDPAAGDVSTGPPTATPSNATAGWQPITPARFVDSRVNLGATRLLGGVPKRIKLTGRQGLPTEASAISGNFTAVDPAGTGYLTVWNCSSPMPVASTLNFATNITVSNAAPASLDSSGYVCLYSPVTTDIVIDISGYYAVSASSRFTPVVPDRLMDTRIGLGLAGRLGAGQVVELTLPGAPAGATGAMLNVTTVQAEGHGFVTVFPCGEMPTTSSVNPVPGATRPNTVTTALSATGSVCIFTSTGVDLIVDVFGYMAPDSTSGFAPGAPFRWVDTRDKWLPSLNFGTGGQRLGAGQTIVMQVAGERGVPADARAVSLNVTATDGPQGGHVTAFPCGDRPPTSNTNFNPGEASANGAMVSLSSTGSLCIYVSSTVHLVVDVNGWWI